MYALADQRADRDPGEQKDVCKEKTDKVDRVTFSTEGW